jgi:NAD(P)-dependent dehydrogenase (short-subunit alcohol dehydrogenase family)
MPGKAFQENSHQEDQAMMIEGKVAVVTGAGRGIGREIALLLAKEGANVVVNDFGGREDGTGGETKVADDVVREIKEAGGTAVGNCDPVGTMENGKRIIQTALDNFGKLDILVNNAGILRDRMIFNMTEEEWDEVLKVHLKGTFACTRAAVPLMREQRSGRIINFTSTSGLVGNIGQANYAAAKMGIVGFTKVVALDMVKYNVTANCISPFAWTRLIGTIPTESAVQKKRVDKLKKMSPADIAPLGAYLASDEAQYINGQIFGVRGKEIFIFSQPRPVRSIHHCSGWTPDLLSEMFKGTLGMHLVPLETSGQVFSYDPLV